MEALNDLVRMGKVRYIGASNLSAWQFQKLNAIAERNSWAKFVSMQNLYNLIYREEEREMNPYCVDAGIGGIPWSPLAMGQLAGKNRDTTRSKTAFQLTTMMPSTEQESNEVIFDRVEEIAKKYNRTQAQIAMAWLHAQPYVTSPIVGVSKPEQLEDLVASMDLVLTEDEIKYLSEPYTARPVVNVS